MKPSEFSGVDVAHVEHSDSDAEPPRRRIVSIALAPIKWLGIYLGWTALLVIGLAVGGFKWPGSAAPEELVD